MFEDHNGVTAKPCGRFAVGLRAPTLATVADVTTPNPPPEGEALEAARRARGLSQREAARRTGISETRWRQITRGHHMNRGSLIHDWGPPDTLARMAMAVDMDPGHFISAGRPDAHEAWQRLRDTPPHRSSDHDAQLSAYSSEALVAEIARRLGIEESDEHGRQPAPTTAAIPLDRLSAVLAVVSEHDGDLTEVMNLARVAADAKGDVSESDLTAILLGALRDGPTGQSDVALAARRGTPSALPSDTGEESQDPGHDEPA